KYYTLFFFQAEDGIRDDLVTGVQTCALPICRFLKANPVAKPEEDDFEPDGDLYSFIVVDANFYVIEANHGELDKITPDGKISRRSEEHTSELQSPDHLVCRLLLDKKKRVEEC